MVKEKARWRADIHRWIFSWQCIAASELYVRSDQQGKLHFLRQCHGCFSAACPEHRACRIARFQLFWRWEQCKCHVCHQFRNRYPLSDQYWRRWTGEKRRCRCRWKQTYYERQLFGNQVQDCSAQNGASGRNWLQSDTDRRQQLYTWSCYLYGKGHRSCDTWQHFAVLRSEGSGQHRDQGRKWNRSHRQDLHQRQRTQDCIRWIHSIWRSGCTCPWIWQQLGNFQASSHHKAHWQLWYYISHFPDECIGIYLHLQLWWEYHYQSYLHGWRRTDLQDHG